MVQSFRSFVRLLLGWWFLTLIFAVPLALKYVTKDPFAISYLNLISVGFIGLGVFALITGALSYQPVRHKPFIWLMLLLFASMAYALFFTDPLRNGIGLWTSRLLQPFLVGLVGFQLLSNNVVTPRKIFAALAASLIPLLVLGLMQYLGFIEYRDPGRITATYFYPNTFARYIDIILLTTLPWILFGQTSRKRVWLGVWALGVVVLLFSQSYNGAVTLLAGVVTILLLLPKPFIVAKRLGLAAILVVSVLVVLNARALPKYETSINDSRLTRLEFWTVASGVIKENFWSGIGIKTWEKEYPQIVEKYYIQKYKKLPLNWGSVQPHNVFLDSFIKAGLPGFIAVTALLLWPIVEGVKLARSYKQHNPGWWVGVSLAAYGVGMFVFGLIDDPIWSDDTMPILFIVYFCLAFCVAQANLSRRQKTHTAHS